MDITDIVLAVTKWANIYHLRWTDGRKQVRKETTLNGCHRQPNFYRQPRKFHFTLATLHWSIHLLDDGCSWRKLPTREINNIGWPRRHIRNEPEQLKRIITLWSKNNMHAGSCLRRSCRSGTILIDRKWGISIIHETIRIYRFQVRGRGILLCEQELVKLSLDCSKDRSHTEKIHDLWYVDF